MTIEELVVKITGDSTSLQTAMEQGADSMDALGNSSKLLSGLLGAAGVAGAMKVAYDAVQKMVEAFRDDEVALLKYNAALKASNSISADGKAILDNFIPVFASMSGISIANTQSMVAMLAATGRTDSQIQTMMRTAQGMAAVMGVDVNTALMQLNQTLSGTTGRLGMQTPALKDLTAEQLKNGEGIRVLSEKYGQFADTLTNSTDVSIKNYKNAYDDMMSAMGASIAETLQPLRDAITKIMRSIADDAPRAKIVLIELGAAFGTILAVVAPTVAGIAAIAGVVLGLTNQYLKNAEAQKKAFADSISAVTQQSDALETLRLKSHQVTQDRLAAEKKANEDRVAAEKKAAEDIVAAQIKGRKDAEKAYDDSLAQIETKVKLGVMTEQEGADAKYAANKKLIDDLIALGYTGAAESNQIGDKTLRAAIARNDALYENTKENVDKRLLAEYELYLQQKDVAAWEAAYLAKKKASEEALAEVRKRYINTRLEETEKVTIAEEAAEQRVTEAVIKGSTGRAQREEQDAQNRIKIHEIATQAMINETERTAKAAEEAYTKDIEETSQNLLKVQKNYIQARLTATEEVTAKEDELERELQRKITEGASSAAQHAEQLHQQKIETANRYWRAMYNLQDSQVAAMTAAENAALEERNAQQIAFVNKRLARTEEVTIKEEALENELQRKITEGASSAAQHAEQLNQRKIEIAARTEEAIANIIQRQIEEEEAAEQAKAVISQASAEKVKAHYILTVLERTEAYEDALEKEQEASEARVNKELQSQIALENGFRRYVDARLAKTEEVTQLEEQRELDLAKTKQSYWDSYSDYIDQKNKEIAEAEAVANKKRAEDYRNFMATVQNIVQTVSQYSLDALKAFADFTAASAKQQTDAVDAALKAQLAAYEAEKQAALEAAGLADKTTLEILQEKVDAAKAAGNAEALAAAEAALKKQQILDEYNKKATEATKKAEYDKAVIKYKADLAQHAVNVAQAIAQGALAVIQAFAQLGPIAGAIAAAVIAGTVAAQIAVMNANKPQPPAAFALGGVSRGGLALVGEQGPELISTPVGARIYNTTETQNILNKNGKYEFHFHSPVALTPAEMKRQFQLTARKLAFQGAL